MMAENLKERKKINSIDKVYIASKYSKQSNHIRMIDCGYTTATDLHLRRGVIEEKIPTTV